MLGCLNADCQGHCILCSSFPNVEWRENVNDIFDHLISRPWGVKVERVEIKDVRVPVQLQRAMAAEAEAAREARAKVVAAEGEKKASKHLKEAALVLEESKSALQVSILTNLYCSDISWKLDHFKQQNGLP